MMIPLTELVLSATTGIGDALPVTVPTPGAEPVKRWFFALSDTTDGDVGISFDGVNEHLRLSAAATRNLQWPYNAVKVWAWKISGATARLRVGGCTEPSV